MPPLKTKTFFFFFFFLKEIYKFIRNNIRKDSNFVETGVDTTSARGQTVGSVAAAHPEGPHARERQDQVLPDVTPCS